MTNKITLFCCCFFTATFCFSGEIKVAVASNFKTTAQNIAKQFNVKTDHNVTIISGSSSALFTMIAHGAPFDVFLSADKDRPLRLINRNNADERTLVNYANGQLAFLSPNTKINSITKLTSHLESQTRKLAIANPKLSPYGSSSLKFIIKYKLYDTTKPHLVMGNNVIQTLQFITSNNAGSGFVSYSQIIQKNINHHYYLLPKDSYSPIKQFGVITNRAKDNKVAIAFMAFLKNDSREIISNAGYLLGDANE
jgi:molybdate transport system substrate-binding protein